MNRIWEFFENMNEVVYVSDMDSYELVYMNRIAREQYQISSLEDLKSRKCYELLQGNSQPCEFCTNHKLQPNQFEEWKYYNSVVNKKFKLKDTVIEDNGKRYRMEMAFDLSVQEEQKKIIKDYIDKEAMINEGLRISLLSTVPEESINKLLAYIGQSLDCDRMYIFEDENGEVYSNTYEWCAEGVVPQKDNLQGMPIDDFKIWMNHFEKNDNVIIKNLEDIKETDPVMYAYLLPQDIHSVVVSPLIFNNKIIGFYGVDNPPQEYLENISTMFLIMGHFIVAQLRRCYLFGRMQKLSFVDQLTGLGNRHAMNIYIENMSVEASIGIVYCDVTGLKRVNDLYGHKAGDELIVRSCECLKRVFPDDSVYRIGGDEFLVLCSEITEAELEKKIGNLRKDMEEHSVVMAVGYEWRKNSVGDIDKLLAEADAKMYEDKRAYYEKHQDKIWRR
jgi:diguanylate cyclase (GGDEF)-like protein